MNDKLQLTHPWLVAVWPGMGSVALSAGYYLLAKLDMNLIAEFETGELFDVDHVEVKDGLIQAGRRPRNRFFVWHDPKKQHDLVIFLGEAQPPLGKYAFCKQLLNYVKDLGIERVFTFAAMATPMHPEQPSRVLVAATDQENLDELKRHDLAVLEGGHVGGLNGVLLGAAAEDGLHGACLLGEMPHVFSQLVYPKASLAILEAFANISGLEVDLSELAEQSRIMEKQLSELLARVEQAYNSQPSGEDEEPSFRPEPAEEEKLSSADEQRIESLFEKAAADRAQAYVLKQTLDRLGVFKDYEDRFLDLFKS